MRASSGYRCQHESGKRELRYRETYGVKTLQLSFGDDGRDCVAECRQCNHNDAKNEVAVVCGFAWHCRATIDNNCYAGEANDDTEDGVERNPCAMYGQ